MRDREPFRILNEMLGEINQMDDACEMTRMIADGAEGMETKDIETLASASRTILKLGLRSLLDRKMELTKVLAEWNKDLPMKD